MLACFGMFWKNGKGWEGVIKLGKWADIIYERSISMKLLEYYLLQLESFMTTLLINKCAWNLSKFETFQNEWKTKVSTELIGRHSHKKVNNYNPSSIYNCSIGHILEHEFCHLGCWAVLWKISETTKILLKYATFEGGFFNFLRAKKNLKFF